VGRCTGDDLEKSGVLESLQSPDKIPVETITVDLPAFDEVRMIEPPQMIGAASTKKCPAVAGHFSARWTYKSKYMKNS